MKKEPAANNFLSKKIHAHSKRSLICFFLLLTRYCALSQSIDPLIHQFQSSIIGYMPYPDSLLKNKIPVITTMKISLDIDGSVKNIELSDSADPLFYRSFLDNKKFLNTTVITTYAHQKKLKNIILLLPIKFYVVGNANTNLDLLNRLIKFKGVEFSGKAVILPSLTNALIIRTDY